MRDPSDIDCSTHLSSLIVRDTQWPDLDLRNCCSVGGAASLVVVTLWHVSDLSPGHVCTPALRLRTTEMD